MLKWAKLLETEEAVDYILNRHKEEAITLYDPIHGYRPRPGGQTRFWEELGGFSEDNYTKQPYRTVALLGGIGSGKSYSGAVWACDKALKYPRAKGVVLANSYPQLAQATLVTLAEVCLKYNIPIDPVRETPEETALAIVNRHPSHCFIGPERAYVYVLSSTSFDVGKQTSRGLQARWAWADEFAYSSEASFNTLDGRIGRGPGAELPGSLCITTTPRGFSWLYYRFADPARSEAWKKTFWFVNCPTRENIEYLGEEYITSLEGNYAGDVGRQELEGLFINTTLGLVYKWFNRQQHALQGEDALILQHNPGERLHLNLDFNASPGVCVLFHVRQQEVHTFKEFYQLDSDIWELMEQVCEWLEKSGHRADIWLHGDASGKARSAASKLSSWDIVKESLKKTGLDFECKFPATNPRVVNRVDAFNFLCRKDRFFIDLDNCPLTLRDLETVTWDGGGIDKEDKLATHLSDALTYGIYHLFPFGGTNQRTAKAGHNPIPGVT
jgi:phage terminase large subunit